MRRNRAVLTAEVLALCVGLVLLFRVLNPDPAVLMKKRAAERAEGDPKAKVWITEYFDYQCPPCANAYFLLSDWMKKNPGKAYLQVRYFPLPAHKNSMKAAIHAECATRQTGKFWLMHHLIFQHQSEWANEAYPELKYLAYAQQAGLDLERWDACTKDPATEKALRDEKAEAEKLGVKITPTFFVNGKMVVGTNELVKELDAAVAAEEKRPADEKKPAA